VGAARVSVSACQRAMSSMGSMGSGGASGMAVTGKCHSGVEARRFCIGLVNSRFVPAQECRNPLKEHVSVSLRPGQSSGGGRPADTPWIWTGQSTEKCENHHVTFCGAPHEHVDSEPLHLHRPF
jgi:hypothetical protein